MDEPVTIMGFWERSSLPNLMKELHTRATGEGDQKLWDLLTRVNLTFSRLETTLKSQDVPCPICASRTRDTDKIGILTVRWDIEYDEYYPVASWPYVTGECQDEQTGFGVIRPRSQFSMGKMLPFNHAEQINEMNEGGEICGYMEGLLGILQNPNLIMSF